MDPKALAYFAAGIGAGLTIMGGAAGIGRLAASAMEGIARQPNAAGDIRANSARQVVSAAGDGATAAIRADHYITDVFGAKAELHTPAASGA